MTSKKQRIAARVAPSDSVVLSKDDGPYLLPDARVKRIDGKPFQWVTIEAFGHTFRDILPEKAADLITLEREQAIYSQFWDDETGQFRYYRVPFLPAEVFGYVEAELAQQEFDAALQANPNATLREALSALSNPEIAHRVIDYGVSTMRDGTKMDIRGCPASFMPEGMEDLVCGLRRDRYELLPKAGSQADMVGLVQKIVGSVPVLCAYLAARRKGKPALLTEDEYDVQDILFVALRAAFPSARREEWTPSVAGSAKRIDIAIPEAHVVLEVKFVRDGRHAGRIADELKIDFESYHSHPDCQHLVALVYDPSKHIVDPEPVIRDLSGLRVKAGHTFTVHVIVV